MKAKHGNAAPADFGMEQISAVMSAPPAEVVVVVLRVDGTLDEVTIDHRKVAELLGGTPSIVGAIPALDAQAVAKSDAKGKLNAHKLPEGSFERKVKGDIVLLRTADDEAASPLPLALKEYKAWVDAGMPDGEPLAEKEEDELSEGDSDDDEPDLLTLPIGTLRKMCAIYRVSPEGSKEALVQRLKVAEGEQGEESSEDGSDEGSEEEIALEDLGLPDLRSLCKELKLDSKGAKAELIERIEEAIAANAADEDDDESSDDEEGDLSLEKMSLSELRSFCKELKLDSKGAKAELIERIEEAIAAKAADEDDEESSDDEEGDVSLEKISLSELRECCKELDLDSKGSKPELISRIVKAANDAAVGDSEDEDEDEEESSEEEEGEEAKPEPKKSTTAPKAELKVVPKPAAKKAPAKKAEPKAEAKQAAEPKKAPKKRSEPVPLEPSSTGGKGSKRSRK
jgi:hypothetical protein